MKENYNQMIFQNEVNHPKLEQESFQNAFTPVKQNIVVQNFSPSPNMSAYSQLKQRIISTPKKFDKIDFFQNRNPEKIHFDKNNLKEIHLSNDGNNLVFGGYGAHVISMVEDDFQIVRFDKPESKLI